jgi:hypothetical protein
VLVAVTEIIENLTKSGVRKPIKNAEHALAKRLKSLKGVLLDQPVSTGLAVPVSRKKLTFSLYTLEQSACQNVEATEA